MRSRALPECATFGDILSSKALLATVVAAGMAPTVVF